MSGCEPSPQEGDAEAANVDIERIESAPTNPSVPVAPLPEAEPIVDEHGETTAYTEPEDMR